MLGDPYLQSPLDPREANELSSDGLPDLPLMDNPALPAPSRAVQAGRLAVRIRIVTTIALAGLAIACVFTLPRPASAGAGGEGARPSAPSLRADSATSAGGTITGRFVSCSGALAGLQASVGDLVRSAISGASGTFELRGVPPGTVEVLIEAGDSALGVISKVEVAADQVTDVGDVQLTDLSSDRNHCSACGHRCPDDATCIYGVCICPEGRIVCGDTCTTLADLAHCRACGNQCTAWPNMLPACGPRDCLYPCIEGTADCDSRRLTGCETRIDADPRNCGACGHACPPGQRCVDFRCQ
jgi:hypothetical protein